MVEEEFGAVFVILVTIILVLEMVIGLIANLAVFIISRDNNKKHLTRGNSFNLNLHVVDSIICVTIAPLTLAYVVSTRFQTPLFCYVFEGSVSFTSTASSLTLFFICLDRYYAVMAPTEPHIISTRSRVFIFLIWIFATISFCSPFFGLKLEMFNSFNQANSSSVTCGEIIWRMEPHYIYEVIYVVTFLMTAFAMLMFYLSMSRVTRRRVAIKDALVKASLSFGVKMPPLRDTERKTLKLSSAIVLAFWIFWGPHLIVSIVGMIVWDSLALDIARILCLLFALMTTIIHPLLYAFMRQRFRQSFRRRWMHRETATVGCATYDGKIATIEVQAPGL
ncbi:G-protein coupled receptor 22-like [Patella vulgata]|uniref:G-protein coupled receptor 22-like n=1 Tax=Patella vulgata TaxID=6465 RepID=UPI00218021C3|nr:G-protein coupled receptor 22-like [Patella vulgata]